jgi:hypothetical protein
MTEKIKNYKKTLKNRVAWITIDEELFEKHYLVKILDINHNFIHFIGIFNCKTGDFNIVEEKIIPMNDILEISYEQDVNLVKKINNTLKKYFENKGYIFQELKMVNVY